MLKHFIKIYFPLELLLVVIILTIYNEKVSNNSDLVETEVVKHVELAKESIAHNFETVVADLKILSKSESLKQYLDSGSPIFRDSTKQSFLLFSTIKGLYDQIRYLDESGKEIIRINYSNGKPVVAAQEQLQHKGLRYYFLDTFRLGKDEIFVSPLDLNIEQGKIEKPLKPMIRFGTPVFDSRGQKRGILLLNYFGAKLIHRFRQSSSTAPGHATLLNSKGFWLIGSDREDEWGFMFDDRIGRTFNKDYPQAWPQVLNRKQGQFRSSNGLFSFTTVYPLKETWNSSSGSGEPFALSNGLLKSSEYFWKIVIHIPEKELESLEQAHRNSAISLFGGLSAVILIVTILLTRANLNRLRTENALRKSEKTHRALVESVNAVPWAMDSGSNRFTFMGRQIEKKLGYPVNSWVDINSWASRIHPDDREEAVKLCLEATEKAQDHDFEYRNITADGREVWVRDIVTVRKGETGSNELIGFMIDVTESKQTEERIKASLIEKEILLSEIHHRVKNNMAVIVSLLGLQADQTDNTQVIDALQESRGRVYAMSAVHEMLYQSENLSFIDLNRYLEKLVNTVSQTFEIGSKVSKKIEAADIMIGINQASPLGLIMNELITNSYKHAFPDNQQGEISIRFQKSIEDQIEFIYQDSGIGIRDDYDWLNAKSMGLVLVRTLVENQLEGSIELKRDPGTCFSIKFRLDTPPT